jgi:hypothetical protein
VRGDRPRGVSGADPNRCTVIEAAVKVLRGQSVVPETVVPVGLVTKELARP